MILYLAEPMERQLNLPARHEAASASVGFVAWWGRKLKWFSGGLSTVDAVDPHYAMQLKGEESGGEWSEVSLCPQNMK